MSKKQQQVKKALTLAEFARAERRAACEVCRLSKEILAELRDASGKGYRRGQQIRWMASRGFKITNEQLNNHYNGKHADDLA